MASRDELVREYLRRQANAPNTQLSDALLAEDQIHVHNKQLVVVPQHQEQQNQEEMEEFKYQVRNWIKLDTEIKDISAKMRMLDGERKRRKKVQDELSKRIMAFMRNNEIDELNSREGIIKSKTTMVKTSLTQKALQQRILQAFGSDGQAEQKVKDIFENRERVEKHRLTRS
jgi:hypothetical protein